ncbi:NUDIX hydrolase [Streptomyces sp. NRRL S-646]|uniref:NUDIX hydrolase n=1 Tax=Streptomyces sp. NRRL S-646 TaxID=1463917 RepID=UPI0004C7C99E|nr:NUDIX hydrolase [Streptomyces sp. NRRL S-646]
MKLDFLPPDALRDGVVHHYCLHCHRDSVEWRTEGSRRRAVCRVCGNDSDRALVLDPAVRWWTDSEGEYWHETAGVFVRDARGRFLFFDRTAFPFGLTIPAGHVEPSESPDEAAVRELQEETGIVGHRLKHVARTPIPGDGCRRGADAHLWHVYQTVDAVEADVTVELGPEGTTVLWLTPDEALNRPITYAVKHLLTYYKDVLAVL